MKVLKKRVDQMVMEDRTEGSFGVGWQWTAAESQSFGVSKQQPSGSGNK